MAVANTLAYYNTATITAVKSFIVEAPIAGLRELLGLNLLTHFLSLPPRLVFPGLPHASSCKLISFLQEGSLPTWGHNVRVGSLLA